jgi:hypothetical protein
MYQIFKARGTEIVFRTIDSASIPMDEANMDYQAYLAWVAEGNTAEEWDSNDNQ